MPLSYTPDDIYVNFDNGAVRRGSDYYLDGKVLKSGHSPSGDMIYGLVRGSANEQYNVNVAVINLKDKPEFQTVCSCPVRRNCKHAVALLLANWFQEMDKVPHLAKPLGGSDYEIEHWLGKLEEKLTPRTIDTSSDFASNTPNRLLYILNLQQFPSGAQLEVKYISARKLQSGGYGKESNYDPARIMSQERAAFISTDDEAILREVYIRHIMDHIEYHKLSESGGGELLLKMLATGRCFWLDKNSKPLTLAKSMKGKMAWQPFEDGAQQLNFTAEDGAAIVLPTVPPFYLNESKYECGPLEIDVPQSAISLIQKAPKVSLNDLPVVTERLQHIIENIPKPAEIKIDKKSGIKPIGCIRFCLFKDDDADSPYYGYTPEVEPVMEITMDYEGRKSSLFAKGIELSFRQGEQIVKLKRDLVTEKKYLDQIEEAGILPLREMDMDDSLPIDLFAIPYPHFVSEEDAWLTFMTREVPLLRDQGWQISFDADFPYSILQVDDWQMDIDESDSSPWFDLSLGIMVGGQSYNLIDIISMLIRQNPRLFKESRSKEVKPPENVLMRMPEGGILALPYDRVSRIVNILLELFDRKSDSKPELQLPKWRAAELSELQSAGLQWQGGRKLKNNAEKLSQFKGIKPLDAPKMFKAKLREYQKEGLGWLQFLREYEFHGVLADDMGLGKTVQTLAHIAIEKIEGRLVKPVLVIAPTSLMYNWRKEAEHFAPDLRVLTLHGPDRKSKFDKITEHDIVLSTYPLVGRDEDILLEHEWHMLILDEAQNIKNPKAKATKAICKLNAKHRLCLTGTPLENHLGELWSIFQFLMPGLLGDELQFRRLFRTPIEKQGDNERAQRLAKRLAPFMLRRRKDQVAKELPAKTEIIRSVVLEGAQRDLYETVRVSMQKKVRDSIGQLGLNRSHIIVLDALLKLRQICCDPRLLKTDSSTKKINSAKLELLMTLLPELLEEGRKILLFSQFTSMLELIESELKSLKINYVKLTGSTQNREKPIEQFQNGSVSLFLISLKAGGTGLNLTAADTVIHYDPWWNPAAESQATDRAYRIGQGKPVFVYKLLTEDTVEARIQVMQEQKRKLAEGLFDTAGKGKLPEAKDLEALFEPLE